MLVVPLCVAPWAPFGLSIRANMELLAIAKSTVPDVYVADGRHESCASAGELEGQTAASMLGTVNWFR